MSLARTVRSFFQALIKLSGDERIIFSDRLYVRVFKTKLIVVSLGIDNVQATTLSIDDATQIFRSIKSACEMNEIREIKISDLSWKTDGRLQSADPDRIVIEFNGPSGFTREVVSRRVASSAVIEFTRKFGITVTVHSID